jgi:predicted RNA-binding Zn ribbon-like protein
MTRNAAHSVDEQGRVLPDAGWPVERAAPGDLELVRRFCNSINRENGADRFARPDGFDRWLLSEGRPATQPNAIDLARVVAFREALHAITTANHQQRLPSDAWAALADVLADVSFSIRAGADGLELIAMSPSPTVAFLGDLALICRRAHDDGTLRRLKSCVHCEWTIYDASKNQSGRWCSMSVCGGRHNARTYRRRNPRSGPSPAR